MEPTTVVIIGMRGAGKSTLGKVAASALGFSFLDMDVVLEKEVVSECRALTDPSCFVFVG